MCSHGHSHQGHTHHDHSLHDHTHVHQDHSTHGHAHVYEQVIFFHRHSIISCSEIRRRKQTVPVEMSFLDLIILLSLISDIHFVPSKASLSLVTSRDCFIKVHLLKREFLKLTKFLRLDQGLSFPFQNSSGVFAASPDPDLTVAKLTAIVVCFAVAVIGFSAAREEEIHQLNYLDDPQKKESRLVECRTKKL